MLPKGPLAPSQPGGLQALQSRRTPRTCPLAACPRLDLSSPHAYGHTTGKGNWDEVFSGGRW